MANGWFSQFPERSQAAQIADAAVADARKPKGPGQASAKETTDMVSLLSSYLDAYGGASGAGAALLL